MLAKQSHSLSRSPEEMDSIDAQRRADERYRTLMAKQLPASSAGSSSSTSLAAPSLTQSPESTHSTPQLQLSVAGCESSAHTGRSCNSPKSGACQPTQVIPPSPTAPSPTQSTISTYYVDVAEKYGVELSSGGNGYELSTWDRLHGCPPDEILPDFMWLGGERNSLFMNEMEVRYGFTEFTHVLFATNHEKSPYKAKYYHRIMLADQPDQDLKEYFEAANIFIEQAARWHSPRGGGAKLLVHCRQGESRSSTLVVAYFMWHYR